jgi:DNA mismatch repair protein MutL
MQIHNSYIVAATPEGLLIVDQHALHERLIYNDLKRRLTDGQIQGQRLLIPQSVDASPADIAAVEGHSQLLASLGIEAASFGPSALAIQQFPAILSGRGVDAAQFLREILDKLADDETADAERLLERILETIACKAAVKAGDPLAPQEMESLLSRLNDADKSSSCPHGRPTTLKLTLRDLEKQFKRT